VWSFKFPATDFWNKSESRARNGASKSLILGFDPHVKGDQKTRAAELADTAANTKALCNSTTFVPTEPKVKRPMSTTPPSEFSFRNKEECCRGFSFALHKLKTGKQNVFRFFYRRNV
jgi:hypothetical protein